MKYPVIVKIKLNNSYGIIEFDNNKQGEGPFVSLAKLRRSSVIYSEIDKEKIKQRISKTENVKLVKDLIFVKPNFSIDVELANVLHHTMVGKISKRKVKGVHFFDPDRTRILEIMKTDERTGIYSARIEKLDTITERWVTKKQASTFFPDNWSIQKLFFEVAYAYKFKKRLEGRIYLSLTPSKIKVKFIINSDGKILTMYPIFQ